MLMSDPRTFVLPMTQFFSLPDYTFEDIEAPLDWPLNHGQAGRQTAMQPGSQSACQVGIQADWQDPKTGAAAITMVIRIPNLNDSPMHGAKCDLALHQCIRPFETLCYQSFTAPN